MEDDPRKQLWLPVSDAQLWRVSGLPDRATILQHVAMLRYPSDAAVRICSSRAG
jgi:hypothetical protein